MLPWLFPNSDCRHIVILVSQTRPSLVTCGITLPINGLYIQGKCTSPSSFPSRQLQTCTVSCPISPVSRASATRAYPATGQTALPFPLRHPMIAHPLCASSSAMAARKPTSSVGHPVPLLSSYLAPDWPAGASAPGDAPGGAQSGIGRLALAGNSLAASLPDAVATHTRQSIPAQEQARDTTSAGIGVDSKYRYYLDINAYPDGEVRMKV